MESAEYDFSFTIWGFRGSQGQIGITYVGASPQRFDADYFEKLPSQLTMPVLSLAVMTRAYPTSSYGLEVACWRPRAPLFMWQPVLPSVNLDPFTNPADQCDALRRFLRGTEVEGYLLI